MSPPARALLALLFGCLADPGAAARAIPAILEGWHAHYQGRLGEVHTLVPSAALALQPGETVHPELRERGFVAEFTGLVELPVAGSYRFGLELSGGQASLRVRTPGGGELTRLAPDSAVSAFTGWTQIAAGPVQITVRFQRAARGVGRLRTLWECAASGNSGFAPEPIPSSAVRAPESLGPERQRGLAALRGRLLLETRGCTNCHAPDSTEAEAVGLRTAPRIAGVTARLAPDWVRQWLLHPAGAGGSADMPDLFGETPAEQQSAEDLLHFLASGKSPLEPEPVGDPTGGRRLFHTVGCVACHGALASPSELYGDPLLSTELPAVRPLRPLGDLKRKWNRNMLPAYLRDPTSIHPDGQMPDLALSESESRALAAYLGGEGGTLEIDRTRVERGRQQWIERRCGACHKLDYAADPGAEAARPARPLRELRIDRGCLDPRDNSTPRYLLDETGRRNLALGLDSARRATGVRSPQDRLDRDLERLACTACHALDGRGGPAGELRTYFTALDDRVDLGDEGRVPPDLSGVGFKLNPAWLRQVLEQGARARPYMATRMPRFDPRQVAAFPAGLAARAGLGLDAPEREPTASDRLSQAGRKLVGPDGMSCTNCHLFRDYPPEGTPGPDIAAFGERLRYEWWSAYFRNPSRYKPGTRMPSFGLGPDSSVKTILDGDRRAQSDALWTYFNLGEFMPPPTGLEPSGALQIVVGDRPVVLRTFLQDVGSRGIAVGLPNGVHFGFDAGNSRLVHAWRGPFLNAGAAWAGRGGQIAGGQGELFWKAPAGMPLLFGKRPERWPEAVGKPAGFRFRGYRLDASGRPWFRYQLGQHLISERCEGRVLPEEKILRSFRIDDVTAGQEFWLNGGPQTVELRDPIGCRTERIQGPEDTTWFQLITEPNTATLQFRLEIEP